MSKLSAAPAPATLVHLRPSDLAGSGHVALALLTTAAGIGLSWQTPLALWAVGQVLLAVGLVQWFLLLHESGHATLFRHRWLNTSTGNVAGFFAIIPFAIWKRIHQRHHKWTGWQDMDPTTETLVPRPLSRPERLLVRVCWRYWIPLFAVLYRLNNFWNPFRLVRLFPKPEVRRRLVVDLAAFVILYAVISWVIGPATLIRLIGVALLLAFIVEDVLLISQHTHIPMGRSHGEPVDPYPTIEQQPFTRSLRMPAWLSHFALHFDEHELHHMYPFVPGYRLGQVPYSPDNQVSWRQWVPAARAVPGDVLLFQSRNESGFDV